MLDTTRTSFIAIKSRRQIEHCVTIKVSNILLLLHTDNATVYNSFHVGHLEITAMVLVQASTTCLASTSFFIKDIKVVSVMLKQSNLS